MERGTRNAMVLRDLGWRVLVIQRYETAHPAAVRARLVAHLRKRGVAYAENGTSKSADRLKSPSAANLDFP